MFLYLLSRNTLSYIPNKIYSKGFKKTFFLQKYIHDMEGTIWKHKVCHNYAIDQRYMYYQFQIDPTCDEDIFYDADNSI